MKPTRLISILIITLINVLFVDKYVGRVVEWHTWVSAIYMFVNIGALLLTIRLVDKLLHPTRWLLGIGIIYLTLGLGIQYSIDPMELQVDRWSAIDHFLEGMLSGIYPYGQSTHLGGYGSPFPVWQVLHLPFYMVGNVGLSIFVVLALFFFSLWKIRGAKAALYVMAVCLFSPACWYEIAVRSDLMTNMILACVLVEWLMYYRIRLSERVVMIGILAGLLLSTRLIAVIPLAALYGYEFLHMGWKKQTLFIGIVAMVFTLTFLPFVFWEGSTLLFFEYNPFVLQTRQGSMLALALFAVIAILITIYNRGDQRCLHITIGGLLTGLVVIAFVETMWVDHAWNALYTSKFDITYLSLGLPFYAMAICPGIKNDE